MDAQTWMSGKLGLGMTQAREETKKRRAVETLATAAREACGRERLAMDSRTTMLSDSLAVTDWELWKRRMQNGLEATEGQTA